MLHLGSVKYSRQRAINLLLCRWLQGIRMIELAISLVVGLAISFGLVSRLHQRNRIVAVVGAWP